MIALALVLIVVLVAVAVALLLGRVDGSLGEPTTTASYVPLPQDRLTPGDLESLRLDTAFRGYRMDQVDEVVGRLTDEIELLRRSLQEREAPASGMQHHSSDEATKPPPPLVGAADPPPTSAASGACG